MSFLSTCLKKHKNKKKKQKTVGVAHPTGSSQPNSRSNSPINPNQKKTPSRKRAEGATKSPEGAAFL